MSNTNPKTLHALLVAIDNYPVARHRLNGCVNDRNAFKEYLERHFGETDLALNIQTLTDTEATKAGIIEGFQHFRAAQDGDICVFYFSGHGSQSPAPQAFWHLAPNRMHESLVCHDSRIDNGKDLMDKELSYLFWEATKDKELHFLTVFDCCHSGNITRESGITSRMAEPAPTPARLEDYHGFEHYKKSEEDGVLSVSPPQGNIVQLGASKSYETAKELRIGTTTRGIFTYSLIETLEQSSEQLTYTDLVQTLKVKISNRVRSQTPQLLAQPQEKRLRFLSAAAKASEPYYIVNFDKGEWKMNAGTVQGIPTQGGTLQLADGTEVTITSVGPNYSVVSGMEGKDEDRSYIANVKDIAFQKLKVAYAPRIGERGKLILDEIFRKNQLFLELIDDPGAGQYWIHADGKAFYLTLPLEERPVFRRVEDYSLNGAETFLEDASSVAKWQSLLVLRNPKSTIRDHEVKIELLRVTEAGNFEDNSPTETVDWKEEGASVFRYEKIDGEWKQPAYKFKITNTGFRKLYVSTLNMESDFRISNRMMAMEELAPGESAWLLDNFEGAIYKTIPIGLDDAFHSWGIIEATEYLKVFISTDPHLDTTIYNQEGLEMDFRKATTLRASGRSHRSNPRIPDWVTKEIPLTIVRPMDEQSVTGGSETSLQENCQLLFPEGVTATVKLSNLKDAERALGGAEAAIRSLNGSSMVWGEDAKVEPLAMTRSTVDSPGLSVLEIKQIQGAEKLDAEHPLVVNTNQELSQQELILPIGYDEETGMLYPLGHSSKEGKIIVETLPNPTPDNERSLFGSIKIFFQKVVLSKIGMYEYPQLAIAEFETNGDEFNYNKDIETVKAKVAEANSIAVAIHGIIGNTKEIAKSLRRARIDDQTTLDQHFDLVLTFDYENLNTPIEDTAVAFKEKLASVGLGAGHSKQLTIVAHSMGGLVSRWFIEKEGGNEVVNHLIQLGTPNLGSPWSSVYEMASMLLGRAINGAAFLKPYLIPLSFLGKYVDKMFYTLQQMHEKNSEFIEKLNDGTDPNVRYTVIAGNTQIIPTELEAAQQSLLKKIWQRFKNRGHYDTLDLFLFKTPNDIAVSVSSIENNEAFGNRQIPAQIEEVPSDHISYFGNPESLAALTNAVTQAAIPEN